MPENGWKVCIDCSPLLVRSAGVKTYLHHWLAALRESGGESVTTFLEPEGVGLHHPSGVSLHFTRLAALWALNRAPRNLISRFAPRCSIFHASNLLRHVPASPLLSATLHDLTVRTVPQFHTPTQRAADEAFFERVLRPARGLICVSRNTMRDAETILRLDPRKMTVIYPGVPDAYFHATPVRGTRPYFLFVSTIEPRKNLDGLLDAWLSLPAEFRRANGLVIAGTPGWKSGATMARLNRLAGEESGIRYEGYVPEPQMPGLTAGALALVYPGFYEGFGIPVAQALAAGCPAIVSNVSSLPEVAGDAALLVDPQSEREIASAMLRIAGSASLRESLIAKGRERARLFTWQRAARESLDYFRRLA